MRAFVVAENSSAVTELGLPTPRPEGSEVQLRVTQCGVCHTDAICATAAGHGSRGTLRLADRGVTYPLVMGHEVVGVIEQVGAEAVGVGIGDVQLSSLGSAAGSVTTARRGDNYSPPGRTSEWQPRRVRRTDPRPGCQIPRRHHRVGSVLGGDDGMFGADRLQRRQQGAAAAQPTNRLS